MKQSDVWSEFTHYTSRSKKCENKLTQEVGDGLLSEGMLI